MATLGLVEAFGKIGNIWTDLLGSEVSQDYFLALAEAVEPDLRAGRCLPCPAERIFRALCLCPYPSVKALVVGQDPYPNPANANGLAFAVNAGVAVPASLRVIFDEVERDVGDRPEDRTLVSWAQQGVMLLNASLTVRAGESNSHAALGWARFTDRVIGILGTKGDVAFLLWGANARRKASLVAEGRVLQAPHPSPLNARGGFSGCGHFRGANEWLVQQGVEPVRWAA